MAIDKDTRDDFWDIEKLLPKKRHSILAPFSTKPKVKTVQIDSQSESNESDSSQRTVLTATKADDARSRTVKYKIDDGLIRAVSIIKMTDRYDFYGNFRKAALLYYDVKTPKCDFAPFFSYMPQYSQFNTAQKDYYFYWRDMARQGKFIKTDYSYFNLYVYEILNLPDVIPAQEGLSLLVKLWKEYRAALPNIDSNMSLWVQDYCLVHNLKCPMDDLKEFIFDIITVAEFKEFYLCDIAKMGNSGVEAMLAYLSDYDWRQGKYAGGEHKEVYTAHVMGAMKLLISRLWDSGEIFAADDTNAAVITRSAFRGCLCTHSVKSRLEIEYLPLSKAEHLRVSVASALKYTENKLRALLGVKSRLAVKNLPDEYGIIIDEYFSTLFDKVNRERARAAMPEYEKQYEATDKGFSIDGADEIERASWSTTARLVEDGDDDIIIVRDDDETNVVCENAKVSVDRYGLTNEYVEFLRCAQHGEIVGMKSIARACGSMQDEMANSINEAFFDGFGDVILEENDGVYVVIDDYREDVEEWLK